MSKSAVKRGMLAIVLVLSVILVLLSGVVAGQVARAASPVKIYIPEFPRSADKEVSNVNWGNKELNCMNGWTFHSQDAFYAKALNGWEGQAVYCIEPSSALQSGDAVSQQPAKFWDSLPSNGQLSAAQQKAVIARVIHYGYRGNVSLTKWVTQNADGSEQMAEYIATQLLVWETLVGERTADFGKVDAKQSGKSPVAAYVSTKNPLYKKICTWYDSIAGKTAASLRIPSFMSRTEKSAPLAEMTYNVKTGLYETTLTDKKNVLSNYELKAQGAELKVSGNTLTVTSDHPLTEVSITAVSKQKSQSLVVWGDGLFSQDSSGKQEVAAYAEETTDTQYAYSKVRAVEAKGSLRIQKEAEDGRTSGVSFRVTGPNGFAETVKTGENGVAELTGLSAGTYHVAETDVPGRYEAAAEQDVTVKPAQTSECKVENKLAANRSLSLVKADAADTERLLSGAVFAVFRDTNANGTYDEGTDLSAGTMADAGDGTYTLSGLKIGTYFVMETAAPEHYILDEGVYTLTFSDDETSLTVQNDESGLFLEQPVPGSITLTKVDKNYPDHKLTGASFEVYLDTDSDGVIGETDEFLGTMTETEAGIYRMDNLAYGTYLIRETKAPEGFLLDEGTYMVNVEDPDREYTVSNDAGTGCFIDLPVPEVPETPTTTAPPEKSVPPTTVPSTTVPAVTTKAEQGPDTGDETVWIVFAVLLTASGSGVCLLARHRRKTGRKAKRT